MNRTLRAVSSAVLTGWEQTGRQMVESFGRHFPEGTPLSFYPEGFHLPPAFDWVSEPGLPSWVHDFTARNGGSPLSRGIHRGSYNFKLDAIKFSKKTAAVIHAAETSREDVLLWIDADCVFHADVDLDWLLGMLPESAAIAWLDREGLYPECGFYMLNLRHPDMPRIIAKWRALYVTDRVFDLPEWHDSYVLEQVIKAAGVETASLSGDARRTSHPAINGPLGAILDHMKGHRKAEGRSRPGDLRVSRAEAYWS